MPTTEQRTRPTRGESHARSYQRRTRVPRDHTATCPTGCGYTVGPTTQALAARGLALHSCDRHRELAARHARGEQLRAAVDRTPKPCPHDGRHEHGTPAAYTLDGCRCRPCKDAAVGYERRRTRQAAYGRPLTVDAEPVRQHVKALARAGIGWKRVAGLAGVSQSAICKLIYGSHGRPRSQRLRRATAEKILAVTPDMARADGALLDTAVACAILHGLVAAGWSIQRLTTETGVSRPTLDGILAGHMTTVETDRKIRTAADRLLTTPPPATNQRERISVSRARNHAARNGWTVDEAWVAIDRPARAVPTKRRPRKARAGRLLDGRTWDEFPEAVPA